MANHMKTDRQNVLNDTRGKGIRWSYLLLSVILWLIVLACLWIIFLLSSESGYESSYRSEMLLSFLKNKLNLNVSSFVLRKAAHLIEYAILTSFSFFAFCATSKISENNPLVEIPSHELKSSFQTFAMLSIWITVLSAVVDEYHQIFVYGRKASIIDVMIDILGGTAVLLFFRLIVAFILHKKRKTERSAYHGD